MLCYSDSNFSLQGINGRLENVELLQAGNKYSPQNMVCQWLH